MRGWYLNRGALRTGIAGFCLLGMVGCQKANEPAPKETGATTTSAAKSVAISSPGSQTDLSNLGATSTSSPVVPNPKRPEIVEPSRNSGHEKGKVATSTASSSKQPGSGVAEKKGTGTATGKPGSGLFTALGKMFSGTSEKRPSKRPMYEKKSAVTYEKEGIKSSGKTKVMTREYEGASTPKEEPAVAAHFEKRGWRLFRNHETWDRREVGFLTIVKPTDAKSVITLSDEDLKMLGSAKTVDLLILEGQDAVNDETLKKLATVTGLKGVAFTSTLVTDEGLKALAACKSLEWVHLYSKKSTPAGIKELSGLPKLRVFSLVGTQLGPESLAPLAGSKVLDTINMTFVDGLSDEVLKPLAQLPNLKQLRMEYITRDSNKLTSAGLQAIVEKNMPLELKFDKRLIDDGLLELLVKKGWLYGPKAPGSYERKPMVAEGVEIISLGDSQVTDKGMRSVLHCTNATSAWLDGTRITDETVKKFAEFKNLNTLSLQKTKVSAAGLEALTGLSLANLHLDNCQLTEEMFVAIGKMTTLEKLQLSEARMEANWLKHLTKLTRLKEISLRKAACDDAAAKELATLPKLEEIVLNDTKLGDAGFEALLKAPKLRRLYVDSTNVTKETYQKAKKEFPKLNLYFYRYDN